MIGRSHLLRIGGRAPAPPADLQQHRAERSWPTSNLARPFPQFGRHAGDERAESLELQRALPQGCRSGSRSGLSFLSSFSYGKSIDNGSGVRTTDGDSLTPSNNYDLELETGPSAFDFRQRWTTSWIWDLPFGQDRRFLNRGGVLDCVLGGWQIGGILTLQDGFPFTVLCGTGTIQNGGGGCYPDPHRRRTGSCRQRAQPDALVQHRRLRRPQPGRPGRSATAPCRATR